MTTVSALALAVATWSRSANVGVAGGMAGWAVLVTANAYGLHDLAAAVNNTALLPYYGLATVALAALTLYAMSTKNRFGRTLWQ